jgi:hypothetical protein
MMFAASSLRFRKTVVMAAALLVFGTGTHPSVVLAQEAGADSLQARVERLEALVDSLAAQLRQLAAAQVAAATPDSLPAALPAGDRELEELRAAARAVVDATPPSAGRPDTAQEASRTRNLNILNPEISVMGDVVGGVLAPDGGDNRATAIPREFEFSFQSALDPYTRTKIFASYEQELEIAGLDDVLGEGDPEDGNGHQESGRGGFDIEEAYVYWVGLPGALGLKVGKFRQEIGLYNRWHTHALLEVERPLVTNAFLGHDGLIQTGAGITLPSFTLGPATQTAWFEVAAANNRLFEGGTGFTYLGRFQSFFDVSPSSYIQVGANGIYGRNRDEELDSTLLGVDLAYRWAPSGRSLYRELTLKGEYYWAKQDFTGLNETGHGGYAQAMYRFDRRWVAGFRTDFLDNFGAERTVYQLVPSVTWWQSEWLRFRLQYNFLKPDGLGGNHSVLFQTVWAIGPHKHESY